MTTLYIFTAFLALVCLVLLLWIMRMSISASRLRELSAGIASTAESMKTELSHREQALETARSEYEKLQQKSVADTETISSLRSDIAVHKTLLEQQRNTAEKQREELEKLQASFRLEFRNLANQMMQERSEQFKATNKESMDTVLGPFRETLSEFRSRVEKIYSEENQQIGFLKNELRSLLELNQKITTETTNLTNALKGNSKMQGDWGEMILETILDSSNLVNGIHYTTQTNLKDEVGNNLRPDVILKLPENKRIVIDSKVSLTAYTEFCSCDLAAEKESHLRSHMVSVKRHVDELGSKRYHELLESPDFVVMFIPNEPAFLCAMQNDPQIWSDAYRKKVIVSSPTNLFALLKLVDDLWKRDTQNRNALEIASEGAKLYDKFVGFVETLEAVGKAISGADTSYQKAMGQLKTGHGNLITRTEKLRKLGVKGTKEIAGKYLQESPAERAE